MAHQHYHYCCNNIGRVVTIRSHSGRVYTGRISRVTHTDVYLAPLGRGISERDKKELKTLAKNAVATKKDKKGDEIFFFFPFFTIPFLTIAAVAAAGHHGHGFGHGFGHHGFGHHGFGHGFGHHGFGRGFFF
jgi:hypothetical protein